MEIGATTRRSDVEALKAHITTAKVTERKAYGHFDTVKTAVASYIGTINPDGAGFLTDTTGVRRFAVVDLEHINWSYAKRVDIDQLWAQAVALRRADPTCCRLTAEEMKAQERNADEHMEPDIYGDVLVRAFEIDPSRMIGPSHLLKCSTSCAQMQVCREAMTRCKGKSLRGR